MQKIHHHSGSIKNCEEALNFYVNVFKDARIISLQRYAVLEDAYESNV